MATFAAAVPLAAGIICPQRGCGRRNAVTGEFLDTLFEGAAGELNAMALRARDDHRSAERWVGERTRMSSAEVLLYELAYPGATKARASSPGGRG